MTAYVGSYVLDNGLAVFNSTATHVYLTSQDPVNYAGVATYALGNKNPGVGNVATTPGAGSPNGEQVTVNAISGGSVTATGTATNWAITDNTNSRLLAVGTLSASQAVTSGNTFSLTSFTIRLPNQ